MANADYDQEVSGDVQFHMNYDPKNSMLEIHVKECRELHAAKKGSADP